MPAVVVPKSKRKIAIVDSDDVSQDFFPATINFPICDIFPCLGVARWHIFKPKITIWVNFGGSCKERCLYFTWPFGLFYGYLVWFVAVLYSFPVLVCCTKKNLATLARWYIFKPKIPIWVNFGKPKNGKGWYILWPFGILFGHLL
jgi:hypothetical protein